MAQLRGLCKRSTRRRRRPTYDAAFSALFAGPGLEVALQAALRVAALVEQPLDLFQRDLARRTDGSGAAGLGVGAAHDGKHVVHTIGASRAIGARRGDLLAGKYGELLRLVLAGRPNDGRRVLEVRGDGGPPILGCRFPRHGRDGQQCQGDKRQRGEGSREHRISCGRARSMLPLAPAASKRGQRDCAGGIADWRQTAGRLSRSPTPNPLHSSQMPASRQDLFDLLAGLGIETTTLEHPPVFTVAESAELERQLSGAHTKNLFLKDEDGLLFLVVAMASTRVDLKGLARTLDAGRFSFGKPELLLEALGVPPGSVTPFGVINDTAHRVCLVVDADLMQYE